MKKAPAEEGFSGRMHALPLNEKMDFPVRPERFL